MYIALHDADNTSFPNLALMKLANYHRARNDMVEFYNPYRIYDKIYSSKVFTYLRSDKITGAIEGGTGYKKWTTVLPDEIEFGQPDYSLYDINYSMGFLTRGCIRKCKHCIVPIKEGSIKAHDTVDNIVKHKRAVFLDNNVLASDHGINQIERLGSMNVTVDFNQGLDARLIDDAMAKRLSKIHWIKDGLRLACDHSSMIPALEKAIKLLRWHNVIPRRYFCYMLIQDIDDATERLKFMKYVNVIPYAQAFRDFDNYKEPDKKSKIFCNFVNGKKFLSRDYNNFEDYYEKIIKEKQKYYELFKSN